MYGAAEEQEGQGQERRHKYASPWGIFALTLAASESQGASVIPFFTLPSAPSVISLSNLSLFFSHGACRRMRQTATVVSLWCIKTNICSLQINYQLMPRPASVISLSGSRSDGLYWLLFIPPHRLTAIFPLSHGLPTPNSPHPVPHHHPHHPHTAWGDRMNL